MAVKKMKICYYSVTSTASAYKIVYGLVPETTPQGGLLLKPFTAVAAYFLALTATKWLNDWLNEWNYEKCVTAMAFIVVKEQRIIWGLFAWF